MGLSYGFCLGGDETEYTSRQFSDAIRQFSGDGVCDSGGKLALSISGFITNLATGYVLTAGRWVENDEPLLLAVPPSWNTEDRTDAIAAVADEELRKAAIEVLMDVDPDAPPDGTLYLVRVKRGSVLLNASDVTDKRSYIIPLSRLSGSAEKVYGYLKTGIDAKVEQIITFSRKETYRAYVSYEQLKGRIARKGGHPEIGELLTACARPEPERQWLLCDGRAVPEEYEELTGVIGGILPDIPNEDTRFKTYIYAGQVGVMELPPVEPPEAPPDTEGYFSIILSVNPDGGGTVFGGGTYKSGQSVTITAMAGNRFEFVGWQENGALISENERYTFAVSGNRNLTAVFAAWEAGISWWETTLPSSKIWDRVVYGNNRFVAMGISSAGSDSQNAVTFAYSSDGINWAQTLVNASNVSWNGLAFGGGKFVAVGVKTVSPSNAVYAYSADGANWVYGETSLNVAVSELAYGNGRFVSTDGVSALYSPDGINWSAQQFQTLLLGYYYAIAYGNGKFSAIDASGRYAIYSTDGVSWNRGPDIPSGDYRGAAYGDGKFVAVGQNKALYSTNGINWTEVNIPAGGWRSVDYGDGKFVAVGNSTNTENSIVAISTDGINWKSVNYTLSFGLNGIAYGNEKFAAVGSGAFGSNQAAYSSANGPGV